MKKKKLLGSKPKDVPPKKRKELKTSKDRKKKKRDRLNSDRQRVSSTEPMSCILKNKNLKSKESKCMRPFKRSMMRFAKYRARLITPPPLAPKLIIGVKS